jgi:hypothetical protein
MSAEVRAARLAEAIIAYKKRGGSIRKLVRESGVAGANIYRARKDGIGLGRETVAKLAPVLEVTPEYLLALTEERGVAAAPEAAMAAWARSLPRQVWSEVRKYGDALAAAHKATSGDMKGAAGRPGIRRGSAGKGSKR